MKLYDWQKDCLEKWENHNCRGIIRAVTGAGKTFFALAAIGMLRRNHSDVRVRIVVPTIPLANQWKTILTHYAPDERWRPGFFGGGKRDDPDRQVMIYVINSARTSLSAHMRKDIALKKHVFLICDECHHYQSPENRKIFNFCTPEVQKSQFYHCLGMSATPFGTDDDGILKCFLGNQIFQYDFDDAVKDGVISPFTVCEVSASFMPDELLEYVELSNQIGILLKKLLQDNPKLQGLGRKQFLKAVRKIAKEADMDPENAAAAFLMFTYKRKEVTNLAHARIRCAVSIIRQLHDKDKIIVFCERISQATELSVVLRQIYGHSCGLYHSQMTKEARKRILSEFRDWRVRILVSCRCLDEGVDIPDANIGIVMSSSSVERQRIQRLGRIIRRAENKTAACLYYIYIRESSDNAAFLSGMSECVQYTLRYYSSENVFTNDVYEYVAANLIERATKSGYGKEHLIELRRCLEEGMIRADYYLPMECINRFQREADNAHESNYWMTMKELGREFQKKE